MMISEDVSDNDIVGVGVCSVAAKGDTKNMFQQDKVGGEWPSSLFSFRQITEVKLGRVKSHSGWVTSEV